VGLGLTRQGYVSAGIQQTTTNILNRFISNVPVPVTPTPTPPPAASAYRSAVIADSPAGYWRLGEAGGTVAADQRATHDGTFAYGPALGQQARYSTTRLPRSASTAPASTSRHPRTAV